MVRLEPMKLTTTRFALVALLAILVGVFVALVIYVTVLVGVIFLVLAVTGTALAYRQKRRLAAAANVPPEKIERR